MEVFRGIRLQLQGSSNWFHYSYSLLDWIQLQEIIPHLVSQCFLTISMTLQLQNWIVFELNCNYFENNGTMTIGVETCFSEMPSLQLGIPWPALRGPLQNYIWKKRRPQPYWGGENSGNALEASNASNYRAWGIPAVLSRGMETLWERFRGLSGIFLELLPESPSRADGLVLQTWWFAIFAKKRSFAPFCPLLRSLACVCALLSCTV